MTDAPPPRRRPNAAPLLLLAVGLAYANAVNTGFVFDDNLWVTNHPSIGDARAYLDQGGVRYLVSLSVLANHRFGGTNPLGYHLFNVAVHALAVLTLFALLRRVLALPRFGGRFAGRGDAVAFAVALLWAVHPLNTQAVTYVIQRAESMMGLFFLLTFYCWTRGATGGSPRLWYPLAVLSYLACCLCKEVGVALPPVLWAFDRVFLADRWRAVLRDRWAPHLGVLAAWAFALRPVVVTATETGAESGVGFALPITPVRYLLTETEVLLHYLRLAVWPTGQCGDMIDWPLAESFAQVWPAFVAVAALFAAGAGLLAVRPAVGFLFAWFFVILGPTSSVMPIADVAFEHRMYLPLIAVLAGLVLAADAALGAVRFRYSFGRAAVAGTLLAAAAVALGVATQRRNAVYRNNMTFAENVCEVRPGNLRAKGSLADMRIAEGRLEEAQQLLDEIRAVNPETFSYVMTSGHIAYLNGRFERAADYFRGLLGHPWSGMPRYVYRFLVPCELAAKRYAAAAAHARDHVALFPASGTYRLTEAACELAAGQPDAARAAAADAARRDPAVAGVFADESRVTLFAPHPVPAAQAGLWDVAYWRVAAANLADGDRNPEWLDTQAQLAARLGRFPEAVAAGEKGVAASAGDPVWRAAHADRLTAYRAGRAFGPKD